MPHRVAVYGTLKADGPNHFRLHLHGDTTRFVGIWKTPPEYTMLDLGSFPGLLEGGTTSIHTEVYDVSDETLALLDELEGVPQHYSREQRPAGRYGIVQLYIYRLIPVVRSGNWLLYDEHDLGYANEVLQSDALNLDDLDGDELRYEDEP